MQRVHLLSTPSRTVEEVVIHVSGSVDADLPVAIVTDLDADGQIEDVRTYASSWPLTHDHAIRAPLLHASDDATLPDDCVGRYHRALRAGDLDAIIDTFEPDGVAREPAGGAYEFRGTQRLREFYGAILDDGGIELEHCTVTDDGTACALEYNAVRWGDTALEPQAGVAVYVRGASGKLVAARIYDDVDPPVLGSG